MKTFLLTVASGLTIAIITALGWVSAMEPAAYMVLKEKLQTVLFVGFGLIGGFTAMAGLGETAELISKAKSLQEHVDEEKEDDDELPLHSQIDYMTRNVHLQSVVKTATGVGRIGRGLAWMLGVFLLVMLFFLTLDTISEVMNPEYYESQRASDERG